MSTVQVGVALLLFLFVVKPRHQVLPCRHLRSIALTDAARQRLLLKRSGIFLVFLKFTLCRITLSNICGYCFEVH
jgi:hypothetical protein